MFSNYYSFISYHPSTDPNNYALLDDKYQLNIAGRRNAVFSMHEFLVLVCNYLHVPSLRAPIYSTQRHINQPGFTYYDDNAAENLVLFPTMVIDVDSTTEKKSASDPSVAL